MAGLYEYRIDIKHRLLFEQKLKENYNVVLFFTTIRLLQKYADAYNPLSVKDERRSFFRHTVLKPNPLRDKYRTLTDYVTSLSTHGQTWNPKQQGLLGHPDIHIGEKEITLCLSNWDNLVKLYSEIYNRPRYPEPENLYFPNGQPSIIAISEYLTQDEVKQFSKLGNTPIVLPKLSYFPFKQMWHFHKEDSKSILFTSLFAILIFAVAVYGIVIQKQPYTGIASFVCSIWLFTFLSSIFDEISKSKDKDKYADSDKGIYISGVVALVIFASTCWVHTPKHHYHVDKEKQEAIWNASSHGSIYDDGYPDDVIVYTTARGECYHVNPNCPTLSRSRNIYSSTKGREKGNHRPCNVCTTR